MRAANQAATAKPITEVTQFACVKTSYEGTSNDDNHHYRLKND
jgi:hypothetical protein